MKIIRKLLLMLIIVIMDILLIINIVHANDENLFNLCVKEKCNVFLKYKETDVNVSCIKSEEKDYIAYGLDKNYPGVEHRGPYQVKVEKEGLDEKLLKILKNGYPYKRPEELGCSNEYQAYVATQQAIYCYKNNNNIEQYKPVGTEGEIVLQTLKNILSGNLQEEQAKTISIVQENEFWEQDEISEDFLSKKYKIKTTGVIEKYKISLQKIEKDLPEGIKLVDKDNQEKEEFNKDEEFKILIPINKPEQAGNFKIHIEAETKIKEILYGKTQKSGCQDYALIGNNYEKIDNEIIEEYPEIEVIEDSEQENNTNHEKVEENSIEYKEKSKDNENKKIENIKEESIPAKKLPITGR